MILLNDFARQWQHTSAQVLAAIAAVGESGWYILGNEVAEFEKAFAGLWQRQHAIGVASGLDALEIALRVAGCHAGDRVLTTPLSAFATTLAIVRLGAIPVYVDTDGSGHLDPALCRELLQRRGEIRFLVPVHLYGYALDVQALRGLRADFGIEIVEDCAQAVMARSAGEPAGAAGRLAATSFYPTKNLGALGDGGAILTDDGECDRLARVLRDYGQGAKYRHEEVGYNSRLDELHAAVLHHVYLPLLPEWTARRRQIAARYREGIRHPCLECLPAPAGSEPVYHLFPLLVREKREFIEYMRVHEILCGEHYPVLIPDQPAMARAAHEVATPLENAARIAACEVSLPIHPYLQDEEVEAVIAACNGWK